MLTLPCTYRYCHRTDYVDGWADICICIKLIETGQKARKKIVPLECYGAKLLAIGKKYVNENGQGVRNNDEFHQLNKGARIVQQRVDMYSYQEYKPKQVRNQKIFTERDQIVQRTVNREIAAANPKPLHDQKHNAIYRPEQQIPQVTEFRRIQFAEPEAPIAYHRFFFQIRTPRFIF